jgi:hypothetical protein
MSAFNYNMEAGFFSGKGVKFRQKALEYRRFARAAEAIRFAIEDLPQNALRGCSLEVDEETYMGEAIRPLYENVDFPLPRRVKLSR